MREELDLFNFGVVICDECHYLKNQRAARTKVTHSLTHRLKATAVHSFRSVPAVEYDRRAVGFRHDFVGTSFFLMHHHYQAPCYTKRNIVALCSMSSYNVYRCLEGTASDIG